MPKRNKKKKKSPPASPVRPVGLSDTLRQLLTQIPSHKQQEFSLDNSIRDLETLLFNESTLTPEEKQVIQSHISRLYLFKVS